MQHKFLYAIGILILFLIHIIAAFALGVYVGRYGPTRQGLTLQGPGEMRQQPQQAPPGQAPDRQLAQPFLPGEPTVIGRIRRVGPHTLDLATREGPRQVILDAETEVRDQAAGGSAGRDSLAEEQIVAIFGVFDDDGRQLQADLVVILPEPEQPRPPANP